MISLIRDGHVLVQHCDDRVTWNRAEVFRREDPHHEIHCFDDTLCIMHDLRFWRALKAVHQIVEAEQTTVIITVSFMEGLVTHINTKLL